MDITLPHNKGDAELRSKRQRTCLVGCRPAAKVISEETITAGRRAGRSSYHYGSHIVQYSSF